MIGLHQRLLAKYPFSLIEEAMFAYVSRKNEIPMPADIINLIEPPEPVPDWAAYVGIRSKVREGRYIMDSEREYLRWCENKAIAKPNEWREQIQKLEQRMLPYEN